MTSTAKTSQELLNEAIEHLKSANSMFTNIRSALKTEMEPIVSRPSSLRIHQIKDRDALTDTQMLSSLNRNKGDLVLHRGTFVVATLNLQKLLEEADTAEIHVFKEFGKLRRYVQCERQEVKDFMSKTHNVLHCEYLRLTVTRITNGVRSYIFRSDLGNFRYVSDWNEYCPYADDGLEFVDYDYEKEYIGINKMIDKLESIEKKRKRIEEIEARWVEHPALKRLRKKSDVKKD